MDAATADFTNAVECTACRSLIGTSYSGALARERSTVSFEAQHVCLTILSPNALSPAAFGMLGARTSWLGVGRSARVVREGQQQMGGFRAHMVGVGPRRVKAATADVHVGGIDVDEAVVEHGVRIPLAGGQ